MQRRPLEEGCGPLGIRIWDSELWMGALQMAAEPHEVSVLPGARPPKSPAALPTVVSPVLQTWIHPFALLGFFFLLFLHGESHFFVNRPQSPLYLAVCLYLTCLTLRILISL